LRWVGWGKAWSANVLRVSGSNATATGSQKEASHSQTEKGRVNISLHL